MTLLAFTSICTTNTWLGSQVIAKQGRLCCKFLMFLDDSLSFGLAEINVLQS